MSEFVQARSVSRLIEILLPLLLIGILIALCIQLLVPFVGLLLWALILAICFYPVHKKLIARGMSKGTSALSIGAALTLVILIPFIIATISAATSVPQLVARFQSGQQRLPPPPASLGSIPMVGPKAHVLWPVASNNLPEFTKQNGPQMTRLTKWLLGAAGGLAMTILALVLAVVFAAITLAYAERARAFAVVLLTRISGDRARGHHYMVVIGATVRSVANGVIGVAFVQALLCGLGFFAIGIPGAGILSLLAMGLGVVQVPVLLVTLPAIIYGFAVKSVTVAILFTVWFIIAGLSDAVLKPMMIGHGLEVPMPVILLGVIGGVMAYGLVGLFIGAVLLAVGWVLMLEWLHTPASDESKKVSPLPTRQRKVQTG